MSSKETKDEIKDESIFKKFFDNLKQFLKKTKLELFIVFILIFIIILINPNQKTIYCQKGGYDNQQQQQPPQPSESSIRTKQIVNQVGQSLRNNQVFQSFLNTVYSVFNAVAVFGMLIFTLAVVPALPLFGFMFIIFIILRNKVASLKAL